MSYAKNYRKKSDNQQGKEIIKNDHSPKEIITSNFAHNSQNRMNIFLNNAASKQIQSNQYNSQTRRYIKPQNFGHPNGNIKNNSQQPNQILKPIPQIQRNKVIIHQGTKVDQYNQYKNTYGKGNEIVNNAVNPQQKIHEQQTNIGYNSRKYNFENQLKSTTDEKHQLVKQQETNNNQQDNQQVTKISQINSYQNEANNEIKDSLKDNKVPIQNDEQHTNFKELDNNNQFQESLTKKKCHTTLEMNQQMNGEFRRNLKMQNQQYYNDNQDNNLEIKNQLIENNIQEDVNQNLKINQKQINSTESQQLSTTNRNHHLKTKLQSIHHYENSQNQTEINIQSKSSFYHNRDQMQNNNSHQCNTELENKIQKSVSIELQHSYATIDRQKKCSIQSQDYFNQTEISSQNGDYMQNTPNTGQYKSKKANINVGNLQTDFNKTQLIGHNIKDQKEYQNDDLKDKKELQNTNSKQIYLKTRKIKITEIPSEQQQQQKKIKFLSPQVIPQNQVENQNQNSKIHIQCLDHCDYIQLQSNAANQIQYLVLSKFTVYFGQFNIETSQKEGNGLILQRQLDKDFNSSYFHYEGQFENDKIVGSGKLFKHKSKVISREGEWVIIKSILPRHPDIAIKHRMQVTDRTTGTSEKPIPHHRAFQSNSATVFQDQLLNQSDLSILQENFWLNSNIIDAYVEHLNYQDEIYYWTLSGQGRHQYKRLQIIPSWLFSWFHLGRNQQNLKYFQEVYSQFEPIQYKIWKIYKKIGVVVNSNNAHWYFVQLDFETMEMIIKDSMRGSEGHYKRTVDILQSLFQSIDGNIKFKVKVCQECLQQRNGYDCGAYTCINAQILAEGKLTNINNGRDMRNFLVDFIQHTVKNN